MKQKLIKTTGSCSPIRNKVLSFNAKAILLLFAFIAVTTLSLFAQTGTREISGVVTDKKDGTPLIGANVVVKGTTIGTVADINGNFKLKIPEGNDVLVVSFMGYLSEEIDVKDKTTVEISLSEDVTKLSEVVVIGYGTMKKSDITGAVASVRGKDLTSFRSGSPLEALQGKIAGADITRTSGRTGENADIQIRGERSLRASGAPLVIVDGIEYGTKIDINQEDITSIEVLKDASSTAIYGSRGANGVILITTKKGEKGSSNIYFSSYYGISQPIQKIPVYDREGYIKAKKDANRSIYSWNDSLLMVNVFSTNELIGYNNGTETDWQDIVLQSGVKQDYLLGFNGGNEKTTYNISLNYYDEEGIVFNDHFDKYSMRFNMESKVKEKIKVGTSSIISYKFRDGQGPNFTNAFLTPPIVSPYDSATGLELYQPAFPNPRVSPLAAKHIVQEERNTRVFATFFAEIQFSNSLDFRTNVGVDLDNDNNGTFTPTFLYNNGSVAQSPVATAEQHFTTKYTVNNILNYQKKFGEHNLTVTGVQEIMKNSYDEFTEKGDGQLFERLTWHNLSIAKNPIITSNKVEKMMLSYLGRVHLNLYDKYILQFSGRYDGASQLSPGNKWAFFPAVSMAWRINKEDFFTNLNFVSDLKLRAGIGKSGNSSVAPNQTRASLVQYPLYYEFGEPGTETPVLGYRPSILSNINLTWETTSQWNIGADLGLFKNRLTANVDYFQSKTTDLLMDDKLPPATGYEEILTNAGETETKGLEFTLKTTNIDAGGFVWTTDITYFQTRSKIVALAADSITKDVGNGWFVGEPTEVWYDYKKIGIWQKTDSAVAAKYGQEAGDIRVVDKNGDSIISPGDEDKFILGTPLAKWSGEMTNGFSFSSKKIGTIEFSFNIYAKMGQMVRQGIAFDPRMLNNALKADYWTPTNPTNDYPKYNKYKANLPYASTLQYMDGSYMKIKYVTLGYTLPREISKKLAMDKLYVYVTINNPFLLYTKMPEGFDPEQAGRTTFPLAKTTLFGLNVQF